MADPADLLPFFRGVIGAPMAHHWGTTGASYDLFTGRHCTRALALGSLEPEDISDDVADFTESQNAELEERVSFYRQKYPVVARLVTGISPDGASSDGASSDGTSSEGEARSEGVN